MNDIELQAEIQRDVLRYIEKWKLPHRTAKSEAASRRHVLVIIRNAVAQCIADDVADSQQMLSRQVDKYRLLREMTRDDR